MGFTVVPASYVILLRGAYREEETFLLLREKTGYRDGHWAVPAGHVDADESARDAAARELAEETGVVADPMSLVPVTTLHRCLRGGPPLEQRVDFYWIAREWDGEPELTEPDRAADAGWFSLRDLPQPGMPQDRMVVEAYLHGAVPPILTMVSTQA